MKTKFLLISLLCIGLLSCETDNKRDNENDSTNKKENEEDISNKKENNEDKESKFDYENVKYPEGATKGVFSVSDTKKVAFSKGNLQYQASTNTWRFAEHQYDMVGMGYGLTNEDKDCYVAGNVQNSDNREISSTYSGWIDLFGWGTGNNPTNSSVEGDYYSTFVDWGVNKISNGGNQAGLWRTLTEEEWDYLLLYRPSAMTKIGIAYVSGIIGLMLLPDDWILPSGAHFTSGFVRNNGFEEYKTVTTYTISEWEVMESAGAVFLPAAGDRYGTGVFSVGDLGSYWSSTGIGMYSASGMTFYSSSVYVFNFYDRYDGFAVRLCSEL